MVRSCSVALLACLTLVLAVPARAAWRFHWQPGQVLTYRVEQVTTATEVVEGKPVQFTQKNHNVKRWQVLAVDPSGVATLQLSLASLRLETTPPDGEALVFDSANPAGSNPEMREQMAKWVGPALVVLRVDGLGRVVEVKECKYGPATKFDSELPFTVSLPEAEPPVGQAWERPYKITLAPPEGTGEKYDASQQYACRTVENGLATITVATAVKSLPASLADQVPLLQMQPEGGVIFDTNAGRLQRVVLHVDKEIKGHQGEGSSYHLQSSYSEEYVGDK